MRTRARAWSRTTPIRCSAPPCPRTERTIVHLGDIQHQGGPEYAYRLRIGPLQPDFALRIVPSSINVRGGATVPLAVYALRKDGFAGEIALALKKAPPGFSLGGGQVPDGQDQVRLTLTVPPITPKEPLSLFLEGRARIAGRGGRPSGRPGGGHAAGVRLPSSGSRQRVEGVRVRAGGDQYHGANPQRDPRQDSRRRDRHRARRRARRHVLRAGARRVGRAAGGHHHPAAKRRAPRAPRSCCRATRQGQTRPEGQSDRQCLCGRRSQRRARRSRHPRHAPPRSACCRPSPSKSSNRHAEALLEE